MRCWGNWCLNSKDELMRKVKIAYCCSFPPSHPKWVYLLDVLWCHGPCIDRSYNLSSFYTLDEVIKECTITYHACSICKMLIDWAGKMITCIGAVIFLPAYCFTVHFNTVKQCEARHYLVEKWYLWCFGYNEKARAVACYIMVTCLSHSKS